jgi:hypothetical protein
MQTDGRGIEEVEATLSPLCEQPRPEPPHPKPDPLPAEPEPPELPTPDIVPLPKLPDDRAGTDRLEVTDDELQ